ncbi:MAG TPA: hypothetical protein VIF02_16635 [Methylocella sp.]|jgi:hypothetical protein
MSIVAQFHAAAAAANSYASLDNVSRLLWAAHAAGQIPDTAAQAAAEALQTRKAALAARSYPSPQKRIHAAPKAIRPRSTDRGKSIARRRAVAMSGAMPSKIAASFTLGETAALSVIAREVQRQGRCGLPIDAIAAMAGICRRTAQNAVRRAERLGLVLVEARPRPGQKSLTNLIEVISPEWISWLRLGEDRMQKVASHGYNLLIHEKNRGFLRDRPLRSGTLRGRISHQEVENAKRDDATGNYRRIYRD